VENDIATNQSESWAFTELTRSRDTNQENEASELTCHH